jgi:protein subunit release factor A
MLDKLAGIEKRFAEIDRALAEVGDDYKRAAALAKERAELEPLVQKAAEYRRVLTQLEEVRQMVEEGDDPELKELAKAELDDLEPRKAQLEEEIKRMLLPKARATTATSSSKSVPAPAAKRLPCSRPTSSACTPDTPSARGGRSR